MASRTVKGSKTGKTYTITSGSPTPSRSTNNSKTKGGNSRLPDPSEFANLSDAETAKTENQYFKGEKVYGFRTGSTKPNYIAPTTRERSQGIVAGTPDEVQAQRNALRSSTSGQINGSKIVAGMRGQGKANFEVPTLKEKGRGIVAGTPEEVQAQRLQVYPTRSVETRGNEIIVTNNQGNSLFKGKEFVENYRNEKTQKENSKSLPNDRLFNSNIGFALSQDVNNQNVDRGEKNPDLNTNPTQSFVFSKQPNNYTYPYDYQKSNTPNMGGLQSDSFLNSSFQFDSNKSIGNIGLNKNINLSNDKITYTLQKAPERPNSFPEGLSYDISQARKKIQDNPLKRYALGIGLAAWDKLILPPIQFGKNLFIKPKETTIGTYEGIKEEATGLVTQPRSYIFQKADTFGALAKNEPGYALGTIGSYYYGIRYGGEITKPLTTPIKKGFQNINVKANPNAVPYEQSGVRVVEGVTVPKTPEQLLKLEGKNIDTVHVTPAKELKYGTELKAIPEGAKGWRKELEQFNFYQSVPDKGKPVAYGGYAGIGQGLSASQTKFVLFDPKIKAFIFRDQPISKTPNKKASTKKIIEYQTETPGTYIPGENIKGMSIEGQVTTSVGKDSPIFRIIENKEGQLRNKFTYYNLKRPTPEILQGRPTLTRIYDTLTSENKKIFFKEAKLERITPNENIVPISLKSKPKISKAKNEINLNEYSSSYGRTRYVSVSRSLRRSVSKVVSSKKSSSMSSNKVSPLSSIKSSLKSSRSISSTSRSKSSNSSKGSPSSSFSNLFSSSVSSPSVSSSLGSSSGRSSPISSIIKSKKDNQNIETKRINDKFGLQRSYKYTPSLDAVFRGIKGKAPNVKIYSGFEARPIIATRNRRRKQ